MATLEQDELKGCYTVRQLAKRWQVGEARVRRLIKRGVVRAFQFDPGGTVRIRPEEIERMETQVLAVRPVVKKRRERVDPEILAMMERPTL